MHTFKKFHDRIEIGYFEPMGGSELPGGLWDAWTVVMICRPAKFNSDVEWIFNAIGMVNGLNGGPTQVPDIEVFEVV
jgi:hypothetical protein